MGNLYFKEKNFPKNELDFGFTSVITIEGLIQAFNNEVKLVVDSLLKAGNNVIIEDHEWSCTSAKELYPNIEILKEYPKNYITIKFKSEPWPG